MIRDQQARQEAIDHQGSFIVQAPAGSGKTELLTQRVLKLLSLVENPEEVVAITFTRKAAREMQNRIIEALYSALEPSPTEPHKVLTWNLANAVVERDRHLNWELLSSPQRLQIKTFDSLCASLANQMPILANFGGQLSPTERPEYLYQQAAKTVIDGIKTQESWAEHLHRVLAHTDNKVQYLQDLLAQQLAKRDQWLRLQAEGANEREVLEQGFKDLLKANLKQLDLAFTNEQKQQLLSAIIFASDYFDEKHELAALKPLKQWPATTSEQVTVWKSLTNFCLTKTGTLRANAPLPALKVAETKEEEAVLREQKMQANELFEQFKTIPLLAEKLKAIRDFPDLYLQQEQWEVIESLTVLMQIAAAGLKVEFKNHGEVDYSEISMAAGRALGDIQNPSELALKLDYAISHLLVDEFQDTSFSQFQLIEQLTSGWQPGDGRTLFVVGDPMQSIYRFREANVGLFIQAREQGVGDIALEFLQLSSNFRSSELVVNWVNQSFAKIFPDYDDPVLGAVKLATAESTIAKQPQDLVSFEVFYSQENAADAEADFIATTIKQCLEQDPKQQIAVLVRARNHAVPLIQALRANAIAYVAEELEQLALKQPVLDLMSLLRVLLHPLDKIGWIGLFKTPWFGLSLKDITLLNQAFAEDLSQALEEFASVENLSQDALRILQRQAPKIQKYRASLYQQPLAMQLEALWLQLGGALALETVECEQLYTALDYIAKLEQAGAIDDYQQVEDSLKKLFSPALRGDDCQVSIMTMHKSKGLEFDTVFLPRLDKKGGSNDKPLMIWEEFPSDTEQSQYLLAPVDQAGQLESLYKLVSRFSKDKDRLETARLLYVAATRAKHRLYLTACGKVSWSSKTEQWQQTHFAPDSLMSLLSPIFERHIESAFLRFAELAVQPISRQQQTTEQGWPRLTSAWAYADYSPELSQLTFEQLKTEATKLEFDWATDIAKIIGILMHRQLELVAKNQWQLSAESIEAFVEKAYQHLLTHGSSKEQAQYAKERLQQGLLNVLSDTQADWILREHEDAACELALTGQIDGQYKSFVIDRTFIDGGVRWIIDYKSGAHLEQDVDQFIQSEVERYRPQLHNYRQLMQSLDVLPVKTALYFPMLKTFVEVD
ncbi:exodeoxyribonuclease V subunit beta [Kangiella sp. TOML190]|uniref:UvrD-helicase domain-containing protein n=1 Tax=Kangiella sp. TOML190 TaxID=2931351 RepID=UPI00203BA14E|nr:UvrD-helicase domain-containing protein [Kangiella sp. TOML190]